MLHHRVSRAENKGCVEKGDDGRGRGVISWSQDAAKSTRVGLAKSLPINSRISLKKKAKKTCCNHKTLLSVSKNKNTDGNNNRILTRLSFTAAH